MTYDTVLCTYYVLATTYTVLCTYYVLATTYDLLLYLSSPIRYLSPTTYHPHSCKDVRPGLPVAHSQ